MQFRQGDIFLEKIDSIQDCEPSKKNSIEGEEVDNSIILALGEATGHAHALRNIDGKAILMKDKNSENYFLMVLKECDLTHEEHSKIQLPIGNYKVIRQRQYTPNKIIQVAD